jgi:hypothetical protein
VIFTNPYCYDKISKIIISPHMCHVLDHDGLEIETLMPKFRSLTSFAATHRDHRGTYGAKIRDIDYSLVSQFKKMSIAWQEFEYRTRQYRPSIGDDDDSHETGWPSRYIFELKCQFNAMRPDEKYMVRYYSALFDAVHKIDVITAEFREKNRISRVHEAYGGPKYTVVTLPYEKPATRGELIVDFDESHVLLMTPVGQFAVNVGRIDHFELFKTLVLAKLMATYKDNQYIAVICPEYVGKWNIAAREHMKYFTALREMAVKNIN